MNVKEKAFYLLTLTCTILPLFSMFFLLLETFIIGINRIDITFILNFPSRFPQIAGIAPSLIGSFLLLILTFIIAIPIGIMSAIFFSEYKIFGRFKKFIELNIANLASVPSVIFGILGLDIFVNGFNLGPSLLASSLTLALLLLPLIIISSMDALKSVPITLREAAISLGSSKLSCIFKVVLPLALPQILTGIILAMARSIGEASPLIVLGLSTYVGFIPDSIFSNISTLPLQIFHWMERPNAGFRENAASGIVVLLFILILFNALVSYLRIYFEKKRGSL